MCDENGEQVEPNTQNKYPLFFSFAVFIVQFKIDLLYVHFQYIELCGNIDRNYLGRTQNYDEESFTLLLIKQQFWNIYRISKRSFAYELFFWNKHRHSMNQ